MRIFNKLLWSFIISDASTCYNIVFVRVSTHCLFSIILSSPRGNISYPAAGKCRSWVCQSTYGVMSCTPSSYDTSWYRGTAIHRDRGDSRDTGIITFDNNDDTYRGIAGIAQHCCRVLLTVDNYLIN